MEIINKVYRELLSLNSKGDHDEQAELMVDLQDYLIRNEYLTEELLPTEKGNSKLNKLVSIFLRVRREFQPDDEKVQDFSYLSVAWDWLVDTGVKINEMRNGEVQEVEEQEHWIMFYNRNNGEQIGGYSVNGTFEGEREATMELLAYENNIHPREIEVKVEVR